MASGFQEKATAIPLLTHRPWLVVGVTRSAWFRMRSADQTPAPVAMPGRRTLYRIADLLRWIDNLGPARRKPMPAQFGRKAKSGAVAETVRAAAA